jgi:hypothetical protein
MQFLTAATVVPVGHFLRRHAEGHGGEEGKRRVLVEEVVLSRVVDVSLTGRHGVEHFERAPTSEPADILLKRQADHRSSR